jgi:hypothetical protein
MQIGANHRHIGRQWDVDLVQCEHGKAAVSRSNHKAGDVVSSQSINDMFAANSIQKLALQLLTAVPHRVPYLTSLADSKQAGCFALRTAPALQCLLGMGQLKLVRMRFREAEALAESSGLALQDCERALHTVHSRVLSIPYKSLGSPAAGEGEEGEGLFVLHPELEWCNHNPCGNLAWRCEAGVVRLLAKQDIVAGDELTFNYGQHSNECFLLQYWFTPAQNPDAVCYLDMGAEAAALTEVDPGHEALRPDPLMPRHWVPAECALRIMQALGHADSHAAIASKARALENELSSSLVKLTVLFGGAGGDGGSASGREALFYAMMDHLQAKIATARRFLLN